MKVIKTGYKSCLLMCCGGSENSYKDESKEETHSERGIMPCLCFSNCHEAPFELCGIPLKNIDEVF